MKLCFLQESRTSSKNFNEEILFATLFRISQNYLTKKSKNTGEIYEICNKLKLILFYCKVFMFSVVFSEFAQVYKILSCNL